MNVVTMPIWANIAAVVAVLVIIAKYVYSLYEKHKSSQEKQDEIVNVKNIVLAVIAIAEGCFLIYKFPAEANFVLGLIDFAICGIAFCLACVAVCDKEIDGKPMEIALMCLFSAAGLIIMATLIFANMSVAAIWLASVVILGLIGYATK